MPIKTLDDITPKSVKNLVDSKIFERGEEYFHEGRVINPILNGNEITAEVEGSSSDNYITTVSVSDGKIHTDCDCPYDWGTCKHAIALLLHWIKRRSKFEDMDKRIGAINKLTHEDLLGIVKRFAKEDPQKFTEIIDLEMPKSPTNTHATDFSKKATSLLKKADYHTTRKLVRQLYKTMENALEKGETEGDEYMAGQLFKITNAVIDNYGNYYDSDGWCSEFVFECLENIAKAWKRSAISKRLRKEILKKAWDMIIDENDLGLAEPFEDFFEDVCGRDWERVIMRKAVLSKLTEFEEKGWSISKNFTKSYHYDMIKRLAIKFGYIDKGGVYLQD